MTKQGAKPSKTMTMEEREVSNATRLASAAITSEFDFDKEVANLAKHRKKRRVLDRRSMKVLHLALSKALLIILAIHKDEAFKDRFLAECEEMGVKFKNSTPIAFRVARVYLTDDEGRASDYGKVLRGAILKGLSPQRLLKLLTSEKETLGSLKEEVEPMRPTLSSKSERSPAASTVAVKKVPFTRSTAAKIVERYDKGFRMAIVQEHPDHGVKIVAVLTGKRSKALIDWFAVA